MAVWGTPKLQVPRRCLCTMRTLAWRPLLGRAREGICDHLENLIFTCRFPGKKENVCVAGLAGRRGQWAQLQNRLLSPSSLKLSLKQGERLSSQERKLFPENLVSSPRNWPVPFSPCPWDVKGLGINILKYFPKYAHLDWIRMSKGRGRT